MPAKFLLSVLTLFFAIGCSSNPRLRTIPQSPPSSGSPKLATISVYPRMALAGVKGAKVRIEYRIARHPDNRSYMVRWADVHDFWGGGGYGKSLDGENEPYAFSPIFLDRLYEGDYEVSLIIIRLEDGEEMEYKVKQTFSVH